MNHAQIDRLLSSVPDSTEPRHLKRVRGYATTARRIDTRIAALRVELERALRAVDDAVPEGRGDEAADKALELARELDSLERIQPDWPQSPRSDPARSGPLRRSTRP